MQRVVVTGAGRGIGYELVSQFLEKNYEVIATYRNKVAKDCLDKLRKIHNSLSIYKLDVVDNQSISKFAKELKGAIDILINNAGVFGGDLQGLSSMDYKQWNDVFEVNTIAPFRIGTALMSNLRQSNNPKIISISSIMGQLNRKSVDFYAYRSSKAALNKVMQVMAYELKDENIIVCPIHPGWVKTEMGGEGAELPVEQSVSGMIKLIESFTMEDSGRFWQYNGEELKW